MPHARSSGEGYADLDNPVFYKVRSGGVWHGTAGWEELFRVTSVLHGISDLRRTRFDDDSVEKHDA